MTLEVIENNDPTVDLLCQRENTLTGLVTLENLTGATVEMYVKATKLIADDDASVKVYTNASATEIEVVNATVPDHGVAGVACVARVHFEDIDLDRKWYHLDVIKAGKRETFAYGKLRVVNI